MPRPRTRRDFDSDVLNLHELLQTISDTVSDMDFVREGKRDSKLDRVSGLLRIAEGMSARLSDEVENGLGETVEA